MDRARSAGRTARSAASASPISRARNGSWRRENPPHLACVAPYDGHVDTYRDSAYTGGIPGGYPTTWWDQVRNVNLYPAAGKPRIVDVGLSGAVKRHPTYDAWWKERAAAEKLARSRCRCSRSASGARSICICNGNIVGFQRAGGPKKLLVLRLVQSLRRGRRLFEHRLPREISAAVLRLLSEGQADLLSRRAGGALFRHRRRPFRPRRNLAAAEASTLDAVYLTKGPSGSVTSLNDGGLARAPPDARRRNRLRLSGCRLAHGRHRLRTGWPARSGAPRAHLHDAAAGARCRDRRADRAHPPCRIEPARHRFLREAVRADAAIGRGARAGIQPVSRIVTKGWLRASMRAHRPRNSRAARAALRAHQAAAADAGPDL